MGQVTREEINFWPAYVDALINVVLNLLFLVGVFTIGLVSLNGEAFLAEQRATQIKLEALRKASTEEEKQKLRRELVGSLELPPPSRFDPMHEAPHPSESMNVREFRFTAAASVPKTTEGGATQSGGSPFTSLQQFIASLAKGGTINQIEFEINQYNQPQGLIWLSDVDRSIEKKWLLLVISGAPNERSSREAFARLVSIRKTLISAGISSTQIQLQVIPAPEHLIVPAELERTVLVIQRNP
jgi:hypothetical protein